MLLKILFTTLMASAQTDFTQYDSLKSAHQTSEQSLLAAQSQIDRLNDEYVTMQAEVDRLKMKGDTDAQTIVTLNTQIASTSALIEQLKATIEKLQGGTTPPPTTGFKIHPQAEQPATTFKRDVYIDPVNGVNSNDCTVVTKPCKSLGYGEVSSKSIKAGDHVHFLPGAHTFISFYGPYGSPNLRDAAEWTWFDFKPGAKVTGIHLRDVKRILVTNATFTPAPGKLAIETSGGEHLVFDGSKLTGIDKDPQTITVAEWNGAPSFFSSRSVKYLAVTNSKVKNIRSGLSVSWNQQPGKVPSNSCFALVENNELIGASGDFSRLWGSDIIMRKNQFLGGYTDGSVDGNHDDLGQGAALPAASVVAGKIDEAVPYAEYSNILIEENVAIDRVRGDQANWSGYQGLFSIFDGVYKNVIIRKNVNMGGAYHAFSLYGVLGATIENNIVLSTAKAGTGSYNKFWIDTPNSKKGLASTNVTVRNNIGNKFNTKPGWVVNENNHTVTNEKAVEIFEKFDMEKGEFDFHIKPTSALYGKGLGVY